MAEFEKVRVSADRDAYLPPRPRPKENLAALIERCPLPASFPVVELEPGLGELAELLLQAPIGISYTGVFREEVRGDVEHRLQRFGSRAKLLRGGVDGELPFENGSQLLLFSAYSLENLRMDHLYMTCSEARRVLREGGHWAILARDPGRTLWERLRSFLRQRAGILSLNVSHYISPEDWVTEVDEFLAGGSRVLVLRRRSDL